MGKLLMLFASWSVAMCCNAQTPARDVYGPLPDWVRVDRAVFTENASNLQPADPRFTAVAQDLPTYTGKPFRPANAPKFSSLDAYRADDRPINPLLPRQFDTPPSNYHPAVAVSDGWKIAVPNIRRNVAKLVLQRSF